MDHPAEGDELMRLTERPLLGRPEDLAAEQRELHTLRAQVATVRFLATEWAKWAEGLTERARRVDDTRPSEAASALRHCIAAVRKATS